MKIIYRIDEEDISKVGDLANKIKSGAEIIIPQNSFIRVYVVSDIGEVTELI